jgi:plastocyanin
MATRRRAPFAFLPGLVLIAAWLLVPATAVAGDPCYHGFELPARTTEATDQVKVMPCAFGPTNARIAVGGTVTFFNGPEFAHLITGANQEWGDRDAELAPNATISYTFELAGIYPYACALHRGMSGTIIVGDAGQAELAAPVTSVTEAPRPDGSVATLLAGAAIAAALVGGALILVRARRQAPVAIEPVPQSGTADPAPR